MLYMIFVILPQCFYFYKLRLFQCLFLSIPCLFFFRILCPPPYFQGRNCPHRCSPACKPRKHDSWNRYEGFFGSKVSQSAALHSCPQPNFPDMGAEGFSPRYSRAIHLFKDEVKVCSRFPKMSLNNKIQFYKTA